MLQQRSSTAWKSIVLAGINFSSSDSLFTDTKSNCTFLVDIKTFFFITVVLLSATQQLQLCWLSLPGFVFVVSCLLAKQKPLAYSHSAASLLSFSKSANFVYCHFLQSVVRMTRLQCQLRTWLNLWNPGRIKCEAVGLKGGDPSVTPWKLPLLSTVLHLLLRSSFQLQLGAKCRKTL